MAIVGSRFVERLTVNPGHNLFLRQLNSVIAEQHLDGGRPAPHILLLCYGDEIEGLAWYSEVAA
jgi:hypothetical protein